MSHFVCAMMRLICRSQQRMASMSAGSRICTLPPWELAISAPLPANWLIRIAAFARRSMSVRANSNFWRILVSVNMLLDGSINSDRISQCCTEA